jgi:hypothetical protein
MRQEVRALLAAVAVGLSVIMWMMDKGKRQGAQSQCTEPAADTLILPPLAGEGGARMSAGWRCVS